MKIVVAVDSDKETIVKKTGQAAFFAIFEDDKPVDFIKNRHGSGNYGEGEGIGGSHHKHEHMEHSEHSSSHKKDIAGLAGCDVILVQAVGVNMKEALLSIGLKVKKIRKKDGVTAEEAVKNYLDNNI